MSEILGDTSPSSTAFSHYPSANRLAERVAKNTEDARNRLLEAAITHTFFMYLTLHSKFSKRSHFAESKMDVKRVTENLFYPTNEFLKNPQKILALEKKIFFFVMGIRVIIEYDHHFQAKQAKVTVTFLHSCLREKAEHRHIPA